MLNHKKWQNSRQGMWRGLQEDNQCILGHKYYQIIDSFSKKVEQVQKQQLLKKSTNTQQNQNQNFVQFKQLKAKFEDILYENKRLKQENEFKSIRIFQMENQIKNFHQKDITQTEKIKQVQKVNNYMTHTITQSAQMLKKYKNELIFIYENYKDFEKQLNQKSGKQAETTRNFTKKMSKIMNDFANTQQDNNLIERINTLIKIEKPQMKRISLVSMNSKNLNLMLEIQLNRQAQKLQQEYRYNLRQRNFICSNTVNFCVDTEQMQEKMFKRKTVWRQINLSFDNQVYLLEGKKMLFRDVRNKKLIRSPEFECRNCQKYQHILTQIFLITKQCFKQIKNKFLSQFTDYEKFDIKQVDLML